MKARQRNLREQILRKFIAIAGVPLFCVGAISAWVSFVSLHDAAQRTGTEVASHISSEIEDYFDRVVGQLEFVNQHFELSELDEKSLEQVFAKVLSSEMAYQAIYLVGANNQITAAVDRVHAHASLNSGSAEIREIAELTRQINFPLLEPFSFEEVSGRLHSYLALPVKDLASGLTVGAIVGEIRGSPLWSFLQSSDVVAQTQGDTYILDSTGRLIGHRNSTLVLKGSNVGGEHFQGIRRGLQGEWVVMASARAHAASQNFTVVTELPLLHTLSPAIALVAMIFGLMVAGVILAWLIATRTTAQILKPIETVAEVARSIAQGDFSRRAGLESADEIGEMGRALDQMTDKVSGLLGDLRTEVDERASAERALRESKEFSYLVADNMPVVIAYFDADMKTRFYNQLGLDWFACSREEIMGKPIDGLIPELDMDAYRARVRKVLAGETVTFEAAQSYPDGQRRNIVATYIPHLDDSGDAIGFFCIVQDNTQRLEIERHLNQAQKMDAIGQLTGGIAHDFNNILMVADGYTRRALNNADDPEKVREALEEVLTGTDRAALLTKQLLSFSRRQIIDKRVFRACDAIRDIESLLNNLIGETYQLAIKDHSGSACVETDASELQQALLNLVINARDAMPQGGKIEIATRLVAWDPESTLTAPQKTAERYVEISVKDEGVGIDEEVAAHIFEPFYTTKDQGKGTGLGLAMVYGFANSSGGAVDVQSAVGEGTMFKIFLPAVDRDPQTIVTEVKKDQLGNGETVLLVEDDSSLLEIVRDMLESLDYTVLTASDGFEAIEVEAEYDGEIDLLLSDVVMPNMGGFQAAEIIRAGRPDINIVFMSGYPNRAGISSEDIPANCQILQKPVKPANLAKALRQALEESGNSHESREIEELVHEHA